MRGLACVAPAVCWMAPACHTDGLWTRELAGGFTLTRFVRAVPPELINVLTIDPNTPGVRVPVVQ